MITAFHINNVGTVSIKRLGRIIEGLSIDVDWILCSPKDYNLISWGKKNKINHSSHYPSTMLQYADAFVFIWDGKSLEVSELIHKANIRNIPVYQKII